MCIQRLYSVRFFITIVLLFAYKVIFSQQTTNLSVVDKFSVYTTQAYQEKLFVHTDREFYTAGEILWFKVYYTDAAFNKPASLSKIAYVDVLNEKNESVLQATISLLPGNCNGSFYLPISLNTGNYIVRAYTSWMRNFDAAYFFEKKIIIVNTLKTNEDAVIKNETSAIAVNFFPEGGDLVNDIESKVGFCIANEQGGINDCNGYIINNSGDTVTSFKPLKFGIGSFNFKPEAGIIYRAVVVLNQAQVINKPMPVAHEQGYTLKLVEDKNEQIVITVQRNVQTSDQSTEQLLLAVHTNQILKFAEKTSVRNKVVLLVDKKKLGTGVIHFTLFNGKDQPVCERLVFIKPSSKVSINVNSDKESYSTRQKINLLISTKSKINSPFNLSASVFKIDSLQKLDEEGIATYLWLSSNIAAVIESPEYYFSEDPDVNEATDNLMLTHGWRRFNWEDVLAGKGVFVKYLPEINGQIINGKAIDIRDNTNAKNIPAYLSVSGYPFGFYVSQSDVNGLVRFDIKNYYGSKLLTSKPGIDVDSFYRVYIQNPYAETATIKKYSVFELTEKSKELLLQKSINMQVQNIYSGDSLRNFNELLLTDTLPFYGFGEDSYKLDDYKRFTTMDEVLREYVAGINVEIRKGKLGLKIFDPAAHDFYKGYTLVFLDGVPLSDPDKILTYDPLKVRKLDVIKNKYVIGKSTFDGIVSFSTYNGTFDAFDLDPKLVAIDFNGLQLQREFYSPVYQTKDQLEKRLPDFRNTLYWAPNINTDAKGNASVQFYTSDIAGKYLVVLHGMSKNGDPVSSFASFSVE